MSIIGAPIGAFSDSGDDVSLAQSQPSPVTIIANNPTAQRIFLLVAKPYDPDAAAETTEYVSSAPFTSASSDTPSLEQFQERLIQPYNVQNQLFEEGVPIAGTSIPGFGAISVANGDGGIDEWVEYEWAGRTLQVYLGVVKDPPLTFAEFAQISEVAAAGLNWDLDKVMIPIRDFRLLLQNPINDTLYEGSGGLEGGDALKGKPKPKVWGRFFQFEPVLVDGPNHTYQLNDGQIQSVDAVRDGGSGLDFDTDVADITTASPAAGEYATSLATGFIKLGEDPESTLTVDGKGNAAGSIGYKEDVAGIIRKIVTEELDFADPGGLDTGAFSDIASSATAPTGYTARLEQVDGLPAVGEIAGDQGCHVTFTRLGKLSIGQITEPRGATADFSLTADDLRDPSTGQFSGRFSAIPTHRVRLGYQRYDTTLSKSDVLGAVSEDDRLDFGEKYRFVTDDDSAVVTRVPEAKTREILTRLAVESDASAEATRILNLLSPTRHLYRAQLETGLFRYFLGDTVEITRSRFDLTGAKQFVVVGFTENVGEFADSDQIILTLWG